MVYHFIETTTNGCFSLLLLLYVFLHKKRKLISKKNFLLTNLTLKAVDQGSFTFD